MRGSAELGVVVPLSEDPPVDEDSTAEQKLVAVPTATVPQLRVAGERGGSG